MSRKVKIILAIVLFVIPILGLSVLSEASPPYWAKAYNLLPVPGDPSQEFDDYANCVRVVPTSVDPRGGYIVVGSTGWPGDNNVLVIRLDQNGNVIWLRNYDDLHPNLLHEGAMCVEVIPASAPNGAGFLVIGAIHDPWPDPRDVLAMRLNLSGNLIWAFRYEFTINGLDYSEWPQCVKITPSNDYIIAGYSNPFAPPNVATSPAYAFALKVDDFGRIAGNIYNIRDHANYETYSVDPFISGGSEYYILAGSVSEPGFFGDRDPMIMKLDCNLSPVWARVYGVTDHFETTVFERPMTSYSEAFTCIRRTSDNKFITSGWTNSRTGGGDDLDMLVMKLHDNGMVDWAKTYANSFTSPNRYEIAEAIDEISVDNYIVAGHTFPRPNDQDLTVLRLGFRGALQWAKALQPTSPYPAMNSGDWGKSIQAIGSTGECVVAGVTTSLPILGQADVLVCKLDPNGVIVPPDSCTKLLTMAVDSPYVCNCDPNVVDSIRTITQDSIRFTFDTLYTDTTINCRVELPQLVELNVYDPGTGNNLILSWSPVSLMGLQGYNVYRSVTSGGPYTKVNPTLVTNTVYLDAGLSVNINYYYYIEAVSFCGSFPCTIEGRKIPRYPVVLVHGLNSNGSIWTIMMSCLRSDGFDHLWAPNLNGCGRHWDNATALNSFIEAKKTAVMNFVKSTYGLSGVRPNIVNLIGHSMGGIISRLYVYYFNQNVDHVIMLGTPNGGNRSAIGGCVVGWCDPATCELTPWFMWRFNVLTPNVPGVDYHVVAGDYPIFHWPWCRYEYSLNDPVPNDKVVAVSSAFDTPTPVQKIHLARYTADHFSIYKVNSVYSDYIKPWLTSSSKAAPLLADENDLANPDGEDTLEQLLPTYPGSIFSGEIKQHVITVDSCSIARLGISWFWGNLDVVLYDPYGTLIDSAYAEASDSVFRGVIEEEESYRMEFYAIVNPVPGNWILEVRGVSVADSGEKYWTEGIVENDLRLVARTDSVYFPYDTVIITGELKKDTMAIIAANVSAAISKPDDSFEDLTLFDDGLHHDGLANDGVYANIFTHISLYGLYGVAITASGSFGSTTFSREAFCGFIVSEPPYMRGDANGDGKITVSDVIYLINYLFKGGPEPIPMEAGDVNCDGKVTIADVVYLINYLFKGGPAPCEGSGASSPESGTELYKGKALTQIGLSSPMISEDSIFELPVICKTDVDIAGVQLEIKYNPERAVLLEPALTPRTKDLQLYSSTKDGIQKIGILDLKGEHYISSGTGALVTLRGKGQDLSGMVINEIILVDKDAHKIPVEIVSEIKGSDEGLISGSPAIPQEFSLSQNYPNPFNPETKISYALPTDCYVKLAIYNISGQKVKTLVDEKQPAGYKNVIWDGKNEQGLEASSGIYFYVLKAGTYSETRKMVRIR